MLNPIHDLSGVSSVNKTLDLSGLDTMDSSTNTNSIPNSKIGGVQREGIYQDKNFSHNGHDDLQTLPLVSSTKAKIAEPVKEAMIRNFYSNI